MATATDQVLALLAEQSTPQLITALLVMDAATRPLTGDERIARAWMLEEVERRWDVEDAMNAWADSEDPSELTYVEALILALPKEALG